MYIYVILGMNDRPSGRKINAFNETNLHKKKDLYLK